MVAKIVRREVLEGIISKVTTVVITIIPKAETAHINEPPSI